MTDPTVTTAKKATTSAVSALKVEAAETNDVTFKFDGEVYTVDKDAANDIEVLEAFEDQKVITPLRTILGPKQWETFKKKKRTAEDLTALAEVMFETLGMNLGESSG